jgi:hypothetical protein
MWVRIFAALIAALLLFRPGIAGAQPTPSVQKSDGERAIIYVYRATSIIGIANFDVSFLHVDGRRLTRISMGGYIPIPVSPGQHKLITTQSLFGSDTGKIRGQAIVTVPAGATVYLRYSEGYKSFVPIILPGAAFVVSSHYYRFERVPGPAAKGAMASMARLR